MFWAQIKLIKRNPYKLLINKQMINKLGLDKIKVLQMKTKIYIKMKNNIMII